VKILLDTHAFLWIAGNWKAVRRGARLVLQDPETELHLSVASIWEISIKAALGRLTLPALPTVYIPRRIADFHITTLDITRDHALAIFGLAAHHADPFDRMIVAQAQLERLTIATRDKIFGKYAVSVLPI
jgi:PIN domain nuclease of toxin-antitoxin system